MEPLSASPGGSPRPSDAAPAGCASTAMLLLTAAWTVVITLVMQGGAWQAEQLALNEGSPLPGKVWLAVTLGNAFLISLPVLPLALWARQPRYRLVYRSWAVGTAYLALMALGRLLPEAETQLASALQTLLSLAAWAILLLVTRPAADGAMGTAVSPDRSWPPATRLALALAAAALIAIPSAAWGALGSPLDAVLAVASGLGLGLFAGTLVDRCVLADVRPGAASASLAGSAAAVTLFIVAAAGGFVGSQLLLMIALPPLAIALVALGRQGGTEPGRGRWSWLPAACLIGIVAAALLTFWDPDELALALGAGEIPDWALRAARTSLLLALAAGILVWWLRRRGPLSFRPLSVWVAAAVCGLALCLVYAFAGRPGFYGEQYFVVLRDQADVQAASALADRAQRTAFVYHTLVANADRTQARLRGVLERGRTAYRPYYLVNALEVNGGPVLRAYLARQPEVDRILDSPHLRPLPAQPAAERGTAAAPTQPGWNITAVGADRVWKDLGVTGKGIVVGQSDSGVQGNHPALRANYRGAVGGNDYNWLDPWNGSPAPVDVDGHGTHTLGTVLGQGGIGVAPDAQWIGCVNLARNLGNPGWYLNCMQFMLAPYPQHGDPLRDGDPSRAAHILNNSWGCPPVEGCDPTALEPAVAALRAAGIFVVAAAGNNGPGCATVTDPIAIYPEVIAVGATDDQGNLASFSSRGPTRIGAASLVKPDIVAPGVNVLSALPYSTYGEHDGTSMATPHIAGVVALMWSANPRLIGDVERTQQILVQTARPYRGVDLCSPGSGIPNDDAGYGIVDAYQAVKAAQAIK